MESLLHFSEDPHIAQFSPRPSRLGFDCVWTIDAAHAPLYWFPRDCPRAAWWALPTTTPEDAARWLGDSDARMVLAMEAGWLERLRACRLWVYRFAAEGFESLRDHGVHVARCSVAPLGPPEPVGDLLERFVEAGDLELRLTPSLRPLERTLTKTSLHGSFIRMRNACAPRTAVARPEPEVAA